MGITCLCYVALTNSNHAYRHALITRSKATSFYLPVAIKFFQIQEDFLNWRGTVEEVGKTRSDITGNKCSWCINVALVVASPEQRKVLEENYGRMDSEKEMRVKEIYEAIGLRERYRIYEASLKEQIEAMIAEIAEPEGNVDGSVLKREVFTSFFHKI